MPRKLLSGNCFANCRRKTADYWSDGAVGSFMGEGLVENITDSQITETVSKRNRKGGRILMWVIYNARIEEKERAAHSCRF